MNSDNRENVWVFHGMNGRIASGVFKTKEKAIEWIERENLQGVLSKYPLDISVYDWAVESEFFTPKKEDHKTAYFKQTFTTASQEHYHFEDE